MRPTKDNRRILWVERVQVLSMLLVVLHHCVPHGYDGPQWLFNLLNAIQYPALVCFFLTSGLFAVKWRRDGWGAYMKRRCLRLLPPYFCVNLLMLLPRYVAARLMGVEAHLTVGWVLMSFLNPHGQGIAPHLWFLPTLLIMAALLPLIEAAVGGNRGLFLGTIAALLIGSALPVRLPTLFCCNELKLYLAWYVIGYALARRRGTACPLRGAVGLALGGAGLVAFAASLRFPEAALSPFAQMTGGALALLAISGLSERIDPLTAAFRGKTYVIYILSLCAQNLAEVVGYGARLPWYVTSLAMLVVGLAVPCAIALWNEKRPLPWWLRRIIGL